MNNIDLIFGLIGLLLTLMMFSYIFGDNLFFRIALTVLVGVSTGYTAAVLITKVLIPLLFDPFNTVRGWGWVWILVPLVLAVLMVLMIVPRLNHFGKVPLAFLVGVFSALTVYGVARGTLAPQLLAIINQFSPQLLQQQGQPDWTGIVWAVMVLLGVIAVLISFQQLSKKELSTQRTGSLLDGISSIGQIFVGITLGAIFVTVFSTALIALISRVVWIQSFLSGLF